MFEAVGFTEGLGDGGCTYTMDIYFEAVYGVCTWLLSFAHIITVKTDLHSQLQRKPVSVSVTIKRFNKSSIVKRITATFSKPSTLDITLWPPPPVNNYIKTLKVQTHQRPTGEQLRNKPILSPGIARLPTIHLEWFPYVMFI